MALKQAKLEAFHTQAPMSPVGRGAQQAPAQAAPMAPAAPPKGTVFTEWRERIAAFEAETRSGDPERIAAGMEGLQALDRDLGGRLSKLRGPNGDRIAKQIGDIRLEIATAGGRAGVRAKAIEQQGEKAQKQAALDEKAFAERKLLVEMGEDPRRPMASGEFWRASDLLESGMSAKEAYGSVMDPINRGEQFDAIMAGLSPQQKKRMESRDVKAMRQEAVLGGDPQAIANRVLFHPDAEDKVGDKVAERDGLQKAGLALPPHLMKPEEIDAQRMDRMAKRAEFYEKRGLAKAEAAAESKADHDVEKKLHDLLWAKTHEGVSRRDVDFSAFDSKGELPRLLRLYRRDELEEAMEDEIRKKADVFFRLDEHVPPTGSAPTSGATQPPAGMTGEALDAFNRLPEAEKQKVRAAWGK